MPVEPRLRAANPVPNTALPGADSALGRTVRARVNQHIGHTAAGAPRIRLRSPWRLAAATTVAVAAAAAVVALVAGPGTTTRLGEQPVEGPAARVLLTLAASAGAPTPSGPGRYAYTAFTIPDYLGSMPVRTPSGPVSVGTYLQATVQTWVAPDGSGRRVVTVDPTPQFFTPAGRAAWVAAGEPPVPPPVGPLTTTSTFGPGAATEVHSPIPLHDVRGLPTSPSALRKVLSATRLPEALASVPGSGECTGSCRLFERVTALLQGPDRGASPALRAALFRVLASVPGIDLFGPTSIHGSPQGTGFRLAVTTPAATWETYCANPDGQSIIERIDGSTGSTRGIVYHTPAVTRTLTAVVDPATTTVVATADSTTPEAIPVNPDPCPAPHPVPSGTDGHVFPTWQVLTASGTTDTVHAPLVAGGSTA